MDSGPAIGVRKIPCVLCYVFYPRDKLVELERDYYCSPCAARVRKDQSSKEREETRVHSLGSPSGPHRAPRQGDTAMGLSGSYRSPRERGTTTRMNIVADGEAPTLADLPARPADSSRSNLHEEGLRSELLQLEYERRRHPHDQELLERIEHLYTELGEDQLAEEARMELQGQPPRPGGRPSDVGAGPRGAPAQVEAIAPPFWEDIPGIFTYPLKGRGLPLMLVGGACFGVALTIAQYSLFGWLLAAVVHGYLWAYWFRVMNCAAQGIDEAPDWPEFFDPWQSIGAPSVAAFLCALIPFGPAVGWALFVSIGPLSWGLGTVLATIGLALVGAFVWPMTLLVYGLFNSIGAAMSYRFVYSSILKILPDYVLFIAAWCLLSTIKLVAVLLATAAVKTFVPFPLMDGLILNIGTCIIGLYFGLAGFRLLGHLYFQGMGRLGWFGVATEPERTISFPILCLGVGSAAVAIIVILAAVAILPAMITDVTGVGTLPFEDGSYLVYDIFDSDWGWYTIRYDIDQVGEHYEFTPSQLWGKEWPDLPTFAVNGRGQIVEGRDIWAGPLPIFSVFDGARQQTIFLGPTRGHVMGTYINDYPVKAKETWKEWETFRVEDVDTGSRLFYDRETGYLVGAECPQIGRNLWCVLVETNLEDLPTGTGRE